MRLENTTDIPNELIREIIRFTRPPGISKFDVRVTNCSHSYKGTAYYKGSSYHATADPFVIVRVGATRHFPMITKKRAGYLAIPIANRVECLVMVLAHELRHLWQAKVKHGRRVGQFSERDADAYALRKLRDWRRM
jgi:hypothetical protein